MKKIVHVTIILKFLSYLLQLSKILSQGYLKEQDERIY
jgi:hypothetical protein